MTPDGSGAVAVAVAAIGLVIAVTAAIGAYGLRLARTTSDFLVASRTVSPGWNAAAIGGEYLSAASFLGIAGLVLAAGADALWYPVGFVAGYLVLLLLVAAPLRRSGAYTVPDFAEARLGSLPVRRLCSVIVVVIGLLYLVPQLQGAGLTLRAVTGAPVWVGAVLVAVVVTVTVAGGGMRSATYVQAFQYWLKLTALAVPAVFLALAWRADGAPDPGAGGAPVFREETAVRVQAPVAVEVAERVRLTVDSEPVLLEPGTVSFPAGSVLVFPAGAAVPHAADLEPATGDAWARPLSGAGGTEHPLYATYALVLATFLGTMGLPHVLVRFYTNPDGAAARRTTLLVIALLGVFYLLPSLYGALGRLYTPELLLTGSTDEVVLALPGALLDGTTAQLLGALLAAGAFAAFLSTSSGLLVATAGVLLQDVLVGSAGGGSGRGGSVRGFRIATVLAASVALLAALPVTGLGLGQVVGLAFAVAASTFCPLLVLGIWWRGLTDAGAAAGLGVGVAASTAAVLATLTGAADSGWPAALLASPAAWSVPAAFAVMVLVSLATRGRVPRGVDRTMLALHAPEALDLARHAPEWRDAGRPAADGRERTAPTDRSSRRRDRSARRSGD